MVNDEEHQSKDSFINRGPMDTIDKDSLFRPRVILNLKSSQPNFSSVKEKIEILGQFRNRSTFKSETLKAMSKSEKMFVILEIVNIFRTLSLPEITEILSHIFGKPSPEELRYLLSILVATNYLTRTGADKEFFISTTPPHSFFDYAGFDLAEIKLEILDLYQRSDPSRFALLGE